MEQGIGWSKEYSTFEQERNVCFGDYQKYFDIGDEIGNMLEHHPLKKIVFSLRIEMSNLLLEMLLAHGSVFGDLVRLRGEVVKSKRYFLHV
jgi:hypothetical protein